MSATASASSSPWSSSSLSLDNSDNPFAPVTSSSPHRPRTLSPQKSLSPTRQASGDASPPPLRVRTERHLSDPSRLRDLVARNRPGTLSETEFDAAGHDKVFASAWLNDEDVAVGTKCNRLLVVNTRSGRRFEIPNFNGAAGNAVLRGGGGGGGGEDASRGRSGVGSPLAGVSSASTAFPACSGIHTVTHNPSRSLLAVGSGRPSEPIQIFDLPSISPRAMLSGHTDVVFAADWLSDGILASGSRDGQVLIWNMQTEELDNNQLEAASSTNATIGKVRDLKYSNRNGRIAALLPTQGVVRLFDVSHSSSTAAATDLRLRHRSELVCLSLDRTTSSSTDLYLVGSEAHVSVVDPRCAGVVMVAESVDEGWGVRSLTMDGTGSGIIAIGGGLGRISFFDMRARKHLSWTDTKAASPGPTDELFMDDSARKTSYRSSGSGWLRHDSVYLSHFSSAIVRNAVYSLNYDDAGVRLFAAGGPLQLNLCGSYMGLWN
ncbi:WD40-repeat-containing domain protein [Zopfochytrium polystomum]|nr:WD40-repeat-containing domain protein [Zopfochytrium polystomum]